MTKLLFIGNSQLSCIRLAFNKNPSVFKGYEVGFYIFPGGRGPAFEIQEDRLKIIESEVVAEFPPRFAPKDVRDRPLSHYDIIVVSALGHLDGGFRYVYDGSVVCQGLLYDYGPKQNCYTDRFLSKETYKAIIHAYFEHYLLGFKFLRELRTHFSSEIIVQPYPLLSDVVRDHPKWPLNQMYSDPIGVHRFFVDSVDSYLNEIRDDLDVHLLPYPNKNWRSALFTPKEVMDEDGIHPKMEYGRLVAEQITSAISFGAETTIRPKGSYGVFPALRAWRNRGLSLARKRTRKKFH